MRVLFSVLVFAGGCLGADISDEGSPFAHLDAGGVEGGAGGSTLLLSPDAGSGGQGGTGGSQGTGGASQDAGGVLDPLWAACTPCGPEAAVEECPAGFHCSQYRMVLVAPGEAVSEKVCYPLAEGEGTPVDPYTCPAGLTPGMDGACYPFDLGSTPCEEWLSWF
jgi:hypothetical protein